MPRPAGVEFGILYPRQTPNRVGGDGGGGGSGSVAGSDSNGSNDFDSGFNPDRSTFGNDNGGGPLPSSSSKGNTPAGSGPVGNGPLDKPLDKPLDRPSGNGPSDRPLGSNDNAGLGPYGASNNGDNDNSIDNDDSSFGPAGIAGNSGNGNRDGFGKFNVF